MQSATSLSLPDLQHPNWIRVGFLIIAISATTAVGMRYSAGPAGFVFMVFFGLIVGDLMRRLSPPLAITFPDRSITVGDLARGVLTQNYPWLAEYAGGRDKVSVWEALAPSSSSRLA